MAGIGRLCHAPHADHRDEWNGGEEMWQNGAGSLHAGDQPAPAHSDRITDMGFTRLARSAGPTLAATATNSIPNATAA